jgi:lipopolysaccharide transport system ATP-binding protein
MTTCAITVAGLCKDYQIRQAGNSDRTLYDALGRALKRSFRAPMQQEPATERFWALRDVNFKLRPGEVAGVIGRNGAGKSTLLKILSRITAPTKGRIEVRGRLASLLEVGTGFHPELSGRENIFLNGAILGMTRAEVARKFDEIVAFAEIDKFVDTPVKRYSSGMYVRLAFAVAAHLETDVLLVDEVLAVGDASFQRKSLGKMSDVARGGRTVLFVSHSLGAVRTLCSRVLLLEAGGLSFDGEVEEGLARYERSFSSGAGLAHDARFEGPLLEKVRIDDLGCTQGGVSAAVLDPLRGFELEVRGTALAALESLEFRLCIFRDGAHVTSCYDTPHATGVREGAFVSTFRFGANVFKPGRYTLGLGASAPTASWLWGADVVALDFSDNRGERPHDIRPGLISIAYSADRHQS